MSTFTVSQNCSVGFFVSNNLTCDDHWKRELFYFKY